MAQQCRKITYYTKEKVEKEIVKFVKKWKKECERHRREIEKTIYKPVERWEKQKKKVCKNWPWPFNLLCEFVMTLIKVIVWIVTKVITIVYEIVCKLVATIVRVVSTIVTWVLRTVSRLICEVVALIGSLIAGRGASGIAIFIDGITSIFEDTVDTATDLVDDAIDSVTSPFGIPGNIIGGLFKGFTGLIRNIGKSIGESVRGVGNGLAKLLKFDFPGAAEEVANGLGNGAARGVTAIGHFVGNFFQEVGQRSVQEIAWKELNRKFGQTPQFEEILAYIGYDGSEFGVPLKGHVYRLYLDSGSHHLGKPEPDLYIWHTNKKINLYDMIGQPASTHYWWDNPRVETVNVDNALIPVGKATIKKYLDSKGKDGPHFRIYSINLDALREKINTTTRKMRQLGLSFEWDQTDIEIQALSDFYFHYHKDKDRDYLSNFLKKRIGRKGTAKEVCTVPVVAAFYFDQRSKGAMGYSCCYKGPTDLTCKDDMSGVAFRDRQPDVMFRYTIAHEMGHYFSLEHKGHDGFQHIMYTNVGGFAPVTWSTIPHYLIWGGEAHFTLDDAKKVWKYLVNVSPDCVKP